VTQSITREVNTAEFDSGTTREIKLMQVVILCGGKGIRAYPFTEYFPKVMVPIGGTPMLVHLMRIYAAHGVREFVLAAGHGRGVLFDYFEKRFADWDVRVVDTGEDADTGERILRCKGLLRDPFFATYGDGLANVDLNRLLQFHSAKQSLATVTAVPLRSQYGILEFDSEKRVKKFEEKPVLQQCWINAGFFVFQHDVFDHWSGASLENDVLPHLANEGLLHTHLHDGFWKSMDTSKDQQEFEQLMTANNPPWTIAADAVRQFA
jgi:glucose-1-phosphate cytidylyltransferase